MSERFRVGLTRDIRRADGTVAFGDVALGLLEDAGVEWDFLPENTPEIAAAHARDLDALILFAPRVSCATLSQAERLAIIARVGVGYDNVDLRACTDNGVLVTITPDATQLPVASAALALMLALAHNLRDKDALVRTGRWQDRFDYVGAGLSGRTLGLVGFGNIGRGLARLVEPFGMRRLAYTPHLTREAGEDAGVESTDLETLLRTSDFVCLVCPLTADTQHLINHDRLALMKETAFLVNVSRGPIVDQSALVEALRQRRIRGAGIDVFEREPVDPNDPILKLENVVLAPHALAHTEEFFRGSYRSACESILAVAEGRVPEHVVNREALANPLLHEKLARNTDAGH